MPSKHARKSPHAGIPSAPVNSSQQFFVIDSTIPCHFINNRSLFITFIPVSKVFRSSFGTDVAIEGHGTVALYFMAFGQLHAFSTTCAYTPSIPYHLYSSIAATKHGHQLVLSSRSPRLLLSPKHRQVRPTIPKYLPLTREATRFILPFHPIPRDSSQPLPFPIASPLPPAQSEDSALASGSLVSTPASVQAVAPPVPTLGSICAPVPTQLPSIPSRQLWAMATLPIAPTVHNPYSLSAFAPLAFLVTPSSSPY